MLKNQKYMQFVNFMLDDLRHEKKHLLFYLTAASTVTGLHREEYKELFLKEAQGEMQHVIEFQNAILGLGVDLISTTAISENHPYEASYSAKYLIQKALEMETQVVANYTDRITKHLELLDEPDRRWLEIFYEKQIEKSREDVDNYQMILMGI